MANWCKGLALRIIQKKVSRVLYNKRVVTLDLASIVAWSYKIYFIGWIPIKGKVA